MPEPTTNPEIDPAIDPSGVDLDEAYDVAVAAARTAGEIQRKQYGRDLAVRMKGKIDVVTEVDVACERAVVAALSGRFPEHRILAEEETDRGGDHPCRWVIDPLDATVNFAHGLPFFCVSIGLEVAGERTLGVVYGPMQDELFVARRGGGATLNGRPLAVSRTGELVESLLVTGFAYNVHEAERDNLDNFAAFTRAARATRRTGCAALDLCYVAAGRFDGFWELGLKAWDVAAGSLMVTEAGGRVTRFDGAPHDLDAPEILATNGRIHDAMVDVLARTAAG
jgi:myo-inositol-1(or 4)-monophosphatase